MILVLSSIDQTVAAAMDGIRTPSITAAFFLASFFGSAAFVAGLTVVACFWLWRSAWRAWCLPLFFAVVGSAITTDLLKLFIRRPRPEHGLADELSFAFPSGHATAAAAVYGFFLYLLWRAELPRPVVWLLTLCVLALILLIGISRLYLGVHYASDVLAGYAVGLAWIFLSVRYGKRK